MKSNDNHATIRVLQVVTAMNVGGIETMLMNIYRNIDREKVQFDFLVHRPEKGFYDNEILSLGGKIYRLIPVRPYSLLRYKRLLNNFFVHHPYSIVHSHISILSYLVLKSAQKYGVKIRISHSHQTNIFVGFKSLIRIPVKIYCKMRLKNVSTNQMACGVAAGKWLFGKKSSFLVVNNAIDTPRYIYNDTIRRQKRQELGIVSDAFVIGHVGSFQKVKNHSYLLQIFKNIHDICPSAKLILIGDGGLRTELEDTVKFLKLQGSVIFTGIRSDVAQLLQAMDVFVFPSISEGLSMALIEAQAAGLHCIVSDAVSKEEAVTDLVDFVSLSEPPKIWAKKALAFADGYERRNTQADIIKAGYDVRETVEWLTNFYIAESKRG